MLLGLVNLEKWNSLPKHYQAVIEQAGHVANNWMLAKYDQSNPTAMKKLLAGGTKLHAFSPAIMQACLKATKELYAETSATNPGFKKALDSISAFSGNGYQWWQVAELGYDSFMARNPLA
jgi:TRAP-type mannitol/chloroaromatic compound transport system substrate-binding protein